MIDKMTKPKQRQKLSKDKNVDRILTKVKGEASKNRQSTALQEGVIPTAHPAPKRYINYIKSPKAKPDQKKLADRSLLIKTYKDELTALGFHGNWNIITDLTQDYCDSDEAIFVLEDCVVTSGMQVVLDKLTKEMRSLSLSNDGLPQITNGIQNEPITISTFFSTFTKDKIINFFPRVGYDPFTRECLKIPYIRHVLDKKQEDTCHDELVNDCEEAKLDSKKEGFNVEGIFDAEIPTATNLRRKETKDKKFKAIIERREGFSA